MTSLEQDLNREALELAQVERHAYRRLERLKVAFDDRAVTEAAEELWKEAAAAVRHHQGKTEGSV